MRKLITLNGKVLQLLEGDFAYLQVQGSDLVLEVPFTLEKYARKIAKRILKVARV